MHVDVVMGHSCGIVAVSRNVVVVGGVVADGVEKIHGVDLDDLMFQASEKINTIPITC